MKGVIYARYSSDNQREESIEAQIRAIREYAERNDINVIKIYVDEAKSATTDDRPQFLQMIKDSSNKAWDCVIVHKLDRFARNRYDSAMYRRELKKNGVRLLSVLENLDDSPESIILESVLEGMAEYYSKNLAREVMKGMKETALQCKHTGGSAPLGYDVAPDKTYCINETEAIIIQTIFDMYSYGHGYNSIINLLNQKGYKTKKGSAFSKSSLYSILTNEKYKGVYVYNKSSSKDISGKRNSHKHKDAEDIIRIQGGMPAIISEDLFDMIQNKMNQNLKPRLNKKRFYMLTGFLYCGICGHTYVGNGYRKTGATGKETIYTCNNRKNKAKCSNKSVEQTKIEKFIIEHMLVNIFSDSAIQNMSKKLSDLCSLRNKNSIEDMERLEEQLTQLNRNIESLIDAVLNNMIDKELSKSRSDKYKQEKQDIELKLSNLKCRAKETDYNENMFKEYMYKQKNDLMFGDEYTKRKVLEQFLIKVTIYPDKIDIEYEIEDSNSDSMVEAKHTVLYHCYNTSL